MPGPTVRRFTWRNNPFSEGGRVIAGVHHAGGVLLPEPDPKRQPVKVQPAAKAQPAPSIEAPLRGQLALVWEAR